MIHIFDGKVTNANPDGDRLPITWRGINYNAPFTDATSGEQELPYGIFAETIGFNTPINFQSEMQPDIVKKGGGLEYYNPRIGSRVLNIRCFIRGRTIAEVGAWLEEIQRDFSPLDLQYNLAGAWPPPGGRPKWTDPWEANFQPLLISRMNDGSKNTAIAAAEPDGQLDLQYAVAPLGLPDPLVAVTQTGWGAAMDLQWLLLDGGRPQARVDTTSSGTTQADITQQYGNAPTWPQIVITMSGGGAGSATFTLTQTGHDVYSPSTMVLDLSGYSGTEVITVNARDRKVYVDGVLTMSIVTANPGWPLVPPTGDTATYTFTNTTNVASVVSTWRETMLS